MTGCDEFQKPEPADPLLSVCFAAVNFLPDKIAFFGQQASLQVEYVILPAAAAVLPVEDTYPAHMVLEMCLCYLFA